MRFMGLTIVAAMTLAGCAGTDVPERAAVEPVAEMKTVSVPSSATGTCLALALRTVTGRDRTGLARTDLRPTGRLFCPAPGIVVWDQAPEES
jgi:hypothetical protein